jgi:hypothetical protein
VFQFVEGATDLGYFGGDFIDMWFPIKMFVYGDAEEIEVISVSNGNVIDMELWKCGFVVGSVECDAFCFCFVERKFVAAEPFENFVEFIV